jgi:cephalosporin-C deacetylase-like acetyl esterase
MTITRSLAPLFLVAALRGGPIRCAEDPASPRTDPGLVPGILKEEYRALEAARPPAPASTLFKERREAIRARHAKALGIDLEHQSSPVTFRVVGTLARDGYEVRKIVFESRPRLPVPALLYIPQTPGPHAAVLSVHGHWQNAKAAPPVQLRNIFLARKGYVVLALDAIGAGERSYRDQVLGAITYHGRQLGYGVLPAGLTLAGLQIEDNRRAIDLLASLSEVDPARIGVTGASGGGNQTFNLTVLDERVRAAAAVCFFGAYRGYLEGAHCACELIPGVLQYGEEGDVAGTIAPRPLLVIAAIRDQGAAFRIEDARRSIEAAGRYYAAAGAPDRVRLREFDCGHDYNKDMREAMVAFFDRNLRGLDSGERVEEPPIAPEEVEALRCFAAEGPGPDALTVPAIAAERSRELIDRFRKSGADWADPASRATLRRKLREEVFGGEPAGGGPDPALVEIDQPARAPSRIIAILAGGGDRYHREGPSHVPGDALRVEVFPRGTGATAWPGAAAVDCPDYVLAQGTAVLGRPILGMWTFDALRAVDRLAARYPGARIGLYGEGAMGTVALLAAALDDRVAAVGTVDSLSSYAFGARFDDRWPLALFVPRILEVGDLPQIAEAIRPRTLAIGSARDGGGAVVGEAAAGPAEVIVKVLEGLAAK